MITATIRNQKLAEIVDIDFLNRLTEVVRLMSYTDNGVVEYVRTLHASFGFNEPDLTPYRVIDDKHAGPGKIVITNKGQRGRTYNNLGIVTGKVPVFLALNSNEFSDVAVLIEPAKLNIQGYIE